MRGMLVLFLVMAMQGFASADGGTREKTMSACNPDVFDPLDVPFPWGSEIEFPWNRIVGNWKTTNNMIQTHFSFQVLKSQRNGTRQLAIIEYRPNSCEYLSTGYGYENGRVIEATMVSKTGRYKLRLHNFKKSDVTKLMCPLLPPRSADNRAMLVVTLQSVTNPEVVMSLALARIAYSEKPVCAP